MTGWIEVECAYCGRRGKYPDDIEIRRGKFVCIDVEACDAREAAKNPETES